VLFLCVADPGCHPKFLHPGSASNNLISLTQKLLSKLSEIWFGLSLQDPNPVFLPIPDPGLIMAGIPDPDPQHWFLYR
jgi:hypothetical protein